MRGMQVPGLLGRSTNLALVRDQRGGRQLEEGEWAGEVTFRDVSAG